MSEPKKNAVPFKRTPAQEKKAAKAAEAAAAKKAIEDRAKMLAQIVNLHIAGHSLSAIGGSIGASADEVERMLANETQAYVRTQPALRTYVRNYVSGKYSELLETVWDDATNKQSAAMLESQDRALRILDRMARLHGAEAPTQTEMKIEAAPEAVESLVRLLAEQQGVGYDTDVFDIDEADIHEVVVESARELEVSRNRVEESDGDDEL